MMKKKYVVIAQHKTKKRGNTVTRVTFHTTKRDAQISAEEDSWFRSPAAKYTIAKVVS